VSTVPPVRREVLVDADPQTAFEVFTARIGRWWPLAELSVYGAGATVAFDDGQIVERGPDGATSLWGTVTRWEPPGTLAFSWHPGRPPERASHVEITFAAAAGQTLVTLKHTGWEVFADPAAARAEYDQGWPMVLDRYREHAGAATWVALLHRPGPDAPGQRDRVRGPAVRRARRVPHPDAGGGVSGRGGPDGRYGGRRHDHLAAARRGSAGRRGQAGDRGRRQRDGRAARGHRSSVAGDNAGRALGRRSRLTRGARYRRSRACRQSGWPGCGPGSGSWRRSG